MTDNSEDSFYAIKHQVEASIAAQPIPAPEKPAELFPQQIFFMPELFQHRLPKEWDSDKHVATLTRVVKGGETLEPLTVFWTGSGWTCIDGHHRAAAYEAAGFKDKVPVAVFEGTLDQAIAHAAETNSRDKLPMKPEEKTHAAWRLTIGTGLSINDIHKATTVARSRISDMRKVHKHIVEKHGEDYASTLRWKDAWNIWKGNNKDDEVGSENWVEREAQKLAERLTKKFANELGRNPEITWRALEIYSPNMVAQICGYLGVNWVDPEELEF